MCVGQAGAHATLSGEEHSSALASWEWQFPLQSSLPGAGLEKLFALEGGHHAGPQARIVPVSYGLLSRKGIYVLCENRELF